MNKDILFGDDARKKILKGVNIVADAVASTLGPRGQTVIFEETIYPTVTKDGVTVAQQVMLEDKFENMGVMITREAAENTNREAGDGTTSTVVLLRSIVNSGYRYVTEGMNPILLKRGMDAALKDALLFIDESKKEVTSFNEKKQIATISANNDEELGDMIAKVIEETGTNGIVTVTNSNTAETSVEYVKGTKLDRGYATHMFINNSKRLAAEVEDPKIILTTDKINMESQLVGMLQGLLADGNRRFVLIASSIEGPAVSFLTQNYLLGKFVCLPINMPSFGDYQRDLFYDLAALTGATVLGEEESTKLKDGKTEHCGTVEKVFANRDETVLTGATGDITNRLAEVNALLEKEKDSFRREQLKKRLGRLNGSIANIKVGGSSETEQTEVKYRMEDALNSTKSAVEDGIVEGAGVALLRAAEKMKTKHLAARADRINEEEEEYVAGLKIVMKAMSTPCEQILKNAGLPADAILEKIREGTQGYNALSNTYQNLFESGVIDPVRCVKNELMNAVATAGILLTSNVAITVKKDERNNPNN